MVQCTFAHEKHPQTGWDVVQLACEGAHGRTAIRFVPAIGSNLISFEDGGVDYLADYGDTEDAIKILGTPILYPTPNRVRGAEFTFDGRTYTFPANDNGSFIHGLVREIPWVAEQPILTGDSASVRTHIAIEPGTRAYELFPIRNTLEVTYTVRPSLLRIDFLVRNQTLDQRLPFGLAIHPYFRIHGPRESVRLQVPATKWMEATDLLPTGKLVDMEEGPADLRQPTSLAALDLDDVFWGLAPARPQAIYYDALGKKVTLTASEFFTHSVVYTPPDKPYFCIENQSCSTDAHNLHARGLEEAAHLAILDPGESLAAWVQIHVTEP